MNICRTLDGLLSSLDRIQDTIRNHRWIGHDHVRRRPLRNQRNLTTLRDNLERHDAAVGCRPAARFEGWRIFRRRAPHGHIKEAIAVWILIAGNGAPNSL